MRSLVAILVVADVIPLAACRIVGSKRHRDPLLPSLMFALAFTLGGLAELLIEHVAYDSKLTFGAIAFAVRGRAASESRAPAA